MRIFIIGGNGTIGTKVADYFKLKHDVLVGGRTSGDVQINIADSQSIKNAFEEIGKIDAIVNIAGDAKWDTFENLSTGILADDPVVKTTSAAMVNGAIHSFVKAVDLEIENEIRVNVVSLGLVEDAYEKYKDYFPGHIPISMNTATNAYAKSVEGKIRGQVIRSY